MIFELNLIKNIFLVFFLCSKVRSELVVEQSQKIVKIEGGNIEGQVYDEYYAFKGIPYAESPTGELRFAPPVPFQQEWDDIRECKDFGPKCIQYRRGEYSYDGEEDCLTLNVYVPKMVTSCNQKIPVIFYIHGGGLMYGRGSEIKPEYVMRSQNMILVTINYRVGLFGFLTTEDEVIPGNFGLKDQVEALRWVQKNIEAFNGDPDKVTISGWSAGGASVHLHFMSPLTDGLFNNGISHSGVALNPFVMMENAREKTHMIANFVNCSADISDEILKCLRNKSARELVMLTKKFQPFLYNPLSVFGAVVEKPSKTAFLTDHPLKLLQQGKFRKLPWLLSQTQDEGSYRTGEFYDENILNAVNENWNYLIPLVLDFNGTTTNKLGKQEVSSQIKKFYLQDGILSKDNFSLFLQSATDRLYHYGAFKAAQLQAAHSPTYFYYFRYLKDSSKRKHEHLHRTYYLSIGHGDDVSLIFKTPNSEFQGVPLSSDEKFISNQLITLYFHFVNSSEVIYDKIHVPKVTDQVKILQIFSPQNITLSTLDNKFGQITFWDSLNIQD